MTGIVRQVGTLFAVSIQKPSRKNRKSSHFAEKLSPSGRVAQGAERGSRLPELSLKVFTLYGNAFPFGESGTKRRERLLLGRIIIKSLPTRRRKYKFRAELGEGGAHAPKEGRKKTVNKSGLFTTRTNFFEIV